jgi:hypothetical protein
MRLVGGSDRGGRGIGGGGVGGVVIVIHSFVHLFYSLCCRWS